MIIIMNDYNILINVINYNNGNKCENMKFNPFA